MVKSKELIYAALVSPGQITAIDVLKESSVHWDPLQIISGIFGGPAFNLSMEVVQNGEICLTMGLCLSPNFSSASI